MNSISWSDESVDPILQRHMHEYAQAGILQAYSLAARNLLRVYQKLDANDDTRKGYAALADRRSELWLAPTYVEKQPGIRELRLHKIHDNGVILPSTTVMLASVGDELVVHTPFEDVDISVVVDAVHELDSLGLRPVDAND